MTKDKVVVLPKKRAIIPHCVIADNILKVQNKKSILFWPFIYDFALLSLLW